MDNFDPYNGAIATNISVLLMTGFVVQGHISEGSHDTEDWSNSCWKISCVIIGQLKQNIVIFNYNHIYCFSVFLFKKIGEPLWA